VPRKSLIIKAPFYSAIVVLHIRHRHHSPKIVNPKARGARGVQSGERSLVLGCQLFPQEKQTYAQTKAALSPFWLNIREHFLRTTIDSPSCFLLLFFAASGRCLFFIAATAI
jgi:hypothetical protein